MNSPDGAKRNPGTSSPGFIRVCFPIFRKRARDELIDRQHLRHARGGVPSAPDILPAFGTALAGADVDVLADIDRAAQRQIIRIKSGGLDRRPQHVGLQARKRRRQKNVVGAAGDQQRLVPGIRHALARSDEFRAHIGEVAAERLRGTQRVAVGDAARQHQRPVEKRPHRAHEHEGIEPAGLAARAGRQQHESVRARGNGALGMADRGDVGKHQRTGIMQRPDHRRRRSDRGDHHFGPVPQQYLQILRQPRIGAMHDQVGADRRGPFAACLGMLLQSALDLAEPLVELLWTTAIHRRERPDHPVAACSYHEFDTRHEKHRRRDQR